MIHCIVWGAGGRMGGRVMEKIRMDDRFHLLQAVDLCEQKCIGKDSGEVHGGSPTGIPIRSYPESVNEKGVLIDFSLPDGPAAAAGWAVENSWSLVSGTTALSENDHTGLEKASRHVPVMWSPNFSLGIRMMLRFVRELHRHLPDSFDVAIHETHHTMKKDRPSGTAKSLLAQISGDELHSRRTDVSATRAARVVGEHEVRFISPFEEITLSHRAFSRDVFVAGALEAAAWITGQNPGFYSMDDYLK